jgi:hypothetical protein
MPPSSRSASSSSGLPRVRFCIPWYKVFLGLFIIQAAALLLLYSKLEEQNSHETISDSDGSKSFSPLEVLTSYSRVRHNYAPQRSKSTSLSIIPIQRSTGTTADTSDTSSDTHSPESYRRQVEKMESDLRQRKQSTHIKSCRYRDGVYNAAAVRTPGSLCPSKQQQQPILYYNPMDRERLLCGQTVPPEGILELLEPCHEPSRLWPVIPDTTGQGMPPITVRFNSQDGKLPASPFQGCDVPCHSSGTPHLTGNRYVDGTNWTLTFSMEGPQYYKSLAIKPNAYKQNKFYSTTSYQSEVPLPYFSWAEYQIQQPAVNYDNAIKGGVFLARNCKSINNREAIVQALQKSVFRIDSLSRCLHNAEPPNGINTKNKTFVMQHYLFYLAFENQNVDDYITEKLWGPFQSGTVPVYFGAPNIHEHAPPHSIISVSDFPSVDALALHLQKVANDKELYNAYHKWRYEPLPPAFHAKYDFTAVHSTCRTCRWAYAKKYGLGWNHANQSLAELSVDRDACLDKQGLVTRPFQEVWLAEHASLFSSVSVALETGSKETAGTCPLSSSKSQALLHDGQLRRTVWQQDGVIDMLFEDLGLTGNLVLRLETLVHSVSLQDTVQPGHVRLQDDRTRMTLLVLPTAGLAATNPTGQTTANNNGGVIDLAIQTQYLPMRLRIIMEDIDTLHRGAEREENYFGQVMVEDFFNPIEAFVDMAADKE